MTNPPAASFLDFFVLEAAEYVEQIDGLLLRAVQNGPDAESLQKVSRALRGSATMAKLPMFAELASAVEAVGRALRQGSLPWSDALKGALTAAVDDLKLLVRAARSWSSTEDQWAMRRIAELSQYVEPSGPPAGSGATNASAAFFAGEAASIAAGLELVGTRPADRDGALNVLRRIRALRGVAGVRDVPGLAEVAEASEHALHVVDLSEERLSTDRVRVLQAAAELLRVIAESLQKGERITPVTPQYRGFLAALDALEASARTADRVIPIAELFYDDRGPHIVEAAPNPPTTPGQRFRIEVVSLGEHLHRVIDEARTATDDIQREHARAELGRALRAIRATAASFSQMAVAQTVEGHLERTGDLTSAALDAISHFAESISPAAARPTPVAEHSVPFRMTAAREAVAALGSEPAAPVPTAPAAAAPVPPPRPAQPGHAGVFAAVKPPTPAPKPSAPVSAPMSTPSSAPVPVSSSAPPSAAPLAPLSAPSSALDSTIAAFDSLASERLAEPVPLDPGVVPVDALLYRGRSALDRAIELRDQLRQAGGPPAAEVLEEIYDLLDLARVPEPAF